MGCRNSKHKHSKVPNDKYSAVNVDTSDNAIIRNYDDEIIKSIKHDLHEDLETFVLNNVLMSTIFHKNYKQEVKDVIHDLSESASLFLEPDILMERVNRNVTYRPLHGSKKNTTEPLVTKRLYVPMNDYIEVFNVMDATDSVEKNGKYQVKMEESSRKGFVKLRVLNSPANHDQQSIKDILPIASSSGSGSSDTESSDHTSSNDTKNDPRFIKDQNEDYRLQDCFVFRKIKKQDIDIMLEEMDQNNLKDEDVYDIVAYLNSRSFMKFFLSKIFPDVAKNLNLIKYEVDNAYVLQSAPAKIFLNALDNDGNKCPVELLPCLKISWPDKQTYKFLNREYPELPENNLWPQNDILQNLRQMECVLVPRGYSKKCGEYPEGDLHWEIQFPLAERYLECILRPEQIKCYLLLLTLNKEYVERFTKKSGVLPEHFRTLIFHEAERDYDGWPEHRLGIKLRSVIKNLSKALQRRTIKDYFIREKNLFGNTSRAHIEVANEAFHGIQQTLLMKIIRVLRNIRYTSGKFYPPLDYKELLHILYKTDWDQPDFADKEDRTSLASGVQQKRLKFADAEKQLHYAKHLQAKKNFIEEKKHNEQVKKGNLSYNIANEIRRGSVDSIKDDWQCEKVLPHQKLVALLKFFINNYINIAKISSRISTKRQTLFYLKQAYYLTTILDQENRLSNEELQDIYNKIKEEEDKCIEIMAKFGSIDVSEAESVEITNSNITNNRKIFANGSIPNGNITHQQVRVQTIDLKSLTKTFASNNILGTNENTNSELR